MVAEEFSPANTQPRLRNVRLPHEGVRRQVRGDLGDIGRNRAGVLHPDPEASTSAVAFDDFEFYSTSGTLDETQVKFLFTHFIETFSIEEDTISCGTRSEPKERVDPNSFDLDLDSVVCQQNTRETTAIAVPKYLAALRRLVEGGDGETGSSRVFPVNLKDVQQFNVNLLRAVVREPADAIVYMDEVLASLVSKEFPDLEQQGVVDTGLRVCLYNHPKGCCMRDLNPSDIESLVAISGVVIRTSHVIPDMQIAVFRCTGRVTRNQTAFICGREEARRLANGEVQEPLQCDSCQQKFSFELCHTKCIFGNKQLLKIQETPESIPEGETPHTVMCYAYDELVDVAKPGDRVEITGIYKASGVRVLARQRNLNAVYRTYIDVNYIGKDRPMQYSLNVGELEGTGSKVYTRELNAATGEFDETVFGGISGPSGIHGDLSPSFSPDLVERFRAIAADPEVYINLVKSLAPNIWEADDVKKGLLCQLFSGTAKQLGHRQARAEMHILLCGDPSTAKSQLLQYVNHVAPRGIYTCGRGTSAVGLTASVTRDPETREFVLESGAIVLSDRGICCIDEFDKMDDGARIILHEVMEQQTVSIAKAGIVCSVNARTSILASANPVNSKYDTRRSVVDNINLQPTLLSRFDLIYLMLDNCNEEVDRQLATHLCSLYAPEELRPTRTIPIPKELFALYISFARSTCFPRLSDEAGQELTSTYVEFRRKGADSSGKSLSATPRQLESLIRLSEALARMQLNDIVKVEHVKEAARLIQVATYNAIVDPLTGRIDFEQLNRGVAGKTREKREALEKAVCDILAGESAGLDKETLLRRLEEKLAAADSENNSGFNTSGFSSTSNFHHQPQQSQVPQSRDLEICLRSLELIGTVARTHSGKYVSHS